MRILIKLFAVLFIGWTISLMINTEANAQGKKSNPTVTNINTESPWFEFIYGGESKDKTGVRIMVQDRQRQYVGMSYARMKAQSNSQDPLNYWVKLVQAPEVGPLAFRQAESLEENALPEDGLTVLVVRLKDLQEAALIWYQ